MLNISDYCVPGTIWPGIISYVQNHLKKYPQIPAKSFSDDDLLNLLKKNAKSVLPANEYDAFRKAVTALKKRTAGSLKKENLYRLCYVLSLESDTQAQNWFLNNLPGKNLKTSESLSTTDLITAHFTGSFDRRPNCRSIPYRH